MLVVPFLCKGELKAARSATEAAAIAHDGVEAHPEGTDDLVNRSFRPAGRTRGLAKSRTTGSQHAAPTAMTSNAATSLPNVMVAPPRQGRGDSAGDTRESPPNPWKSLETAVAFAAEAHSSSGLDEGVMGAIIHPRVARARGASARLPAPGHRVSDNHLVDCERGPLPHSQLRGGSEVVGGTIGGPMSREPLAGGFISPGVALPVGLADTPQGGLFTGQVRGDPPKVGRWTAPQRENFFGHFPNVAVSLRKAPSKKLQEGAMCYLAVEDQETEVREE